ncbi:MAG TPA: VOC family protein [Xanthobacteraceae bacterium]|nr:VOC family protein [Xanthobacteraceae bacterium]
MLDHLGFGVSDYARSKTFYEKALAPLGIGVVMEVTPAQGAEHDAVGFGKDGKPFFWFGRGDAARVHVAFATQSRAEVDAFYRAAIAAGGKDNGAPGLRPHYHANYYGAFVLDPDGNNIEAVCHR